MELTDVIEELSEEVAAGFTPTCMDCEKTATWALIHTCCHHVEFLCDEHQAESMRALVEFIRSCDVAMCVLCHARFAEPAVRWERV